MHVSSDVRGPSTGVCQYQNFLSFKRRIITSLLHHYYIIIKPSPLTADTSLARLVSCGCEANTTVARCVSISSLAPISSYNIQISLHISCLILTVVKTIWPVAMATLQAPELNLERVVRIELDATSLVIMDEFNKWDASQLMIIKNLRY